MNTEPNTEPIRDEQIPDGAVLVGIGGGELDETCVAWAAAAAQRTGRPLHLLHAREDILGLTTFDPVMTGWAVLPTELPAQDGLLENALEVSRARWPQLTITGSSPVGRRELVLVESSQHGYLLVAGAPERHGLLRIIERPAMAVAMHSACPVVIVPHGIRPEPDGPVIAAVDGSEHSRFALRRAFVVAQTRREPLVVVTAWTAALAGRDSGGAGGPGEPSWESIEEGHRALVQEMVDEAGREFPEVPVEIRAIQGRPAQVITGLSQEAGLLVLGSRGHGGFRGMLLGSVTHEVIETAHCPVLIARRSNHA